MLDYPMNLQDILFLLQGISTMDYATIALKPCKPGYTIPAAWKGYEDVTIFSKDGLSLAVNSCVLASASAMCRQMLESVADDKLCVLTELPWKDLVKVYTFIATGHIYSHASVDKVLQDESSATAFATFGIDLASLKLEQTQVIKRVVKNVERPAKSESSKRPASSESSKVKTSVPTKKPKLEKPTVAVVNNEASNLVLDRRSRRSRKEPQSDPTQYITKCQVLKEWNKSQERFTPNKASRLKFLKRLFWEHFGDVTYSDSVWEVLEQNLKKLFDVLPEKTAHRHVIKDYMKYVPENDLFFSIDDKSPHEAESLQTKVELDDDMAAYSSDEHTPLNKEEPDPDYHPKKKSKKSTEAKEEKIENLRCISCGEVKRTKKNINYHIRLAGPLHDTKCRICPDFEAKTWTEHEQHLVEKHDGSIQYKCGHCDESAWFNSQSQYKSHKLNCSAWKEFKAQSHLKWLNGTKKNKKQKQAKRKICDQCGVKVRNSIVHMKRVHGTHSIPCTHPGCNAIIKHPDIVKYHMKIHETRICNICGYITAEKYMNRHMLREHEEGRIKPFVCDICNKGFEDKQNYLDHKNIHAGIKPHQCKECPIGFASKANLLMHVKTVHLGLKRTSKK